MESTARETKSNQISNAIDELRDAVGKVRKLNARIDGQISTLIEPELSEKGKPQQPQRSLAEILETTPSDIRLITDELIKLIHEIESKLF